MGWTKPSEKYITSSTWIISPSRGENEKSFETTTQVVYPPFYSSFLLNIRCGSPEICSTVSKWFGKLQRLKTPNYCINLGLLKTCCITKWVQKSNFQTPQPFYTPQKTEVCAPPYWQMGQYFDLFIWNELDHIPHSFCQLVCRKLVHCCIESRLSMEASSDR